MGLSEYGPYALPLAIIAVLAQVVWTLTKKRRENGSTENFRQELKADLKEIKTSVSAIDRTLQTLITDMTLLKYRVTRLEDGKDKTK